MTLDTIALIESVQLGVIKINHQNAYVGANEACAFEIVRFAVD